MKSVIALTLSVLTATASAQSSAEDLYAQGQTAYDARDYATAVAKWQKAYDVSRETALLFNLAQAMRLGGECSRALVTYRRFVTDDADRSSEQHKLAEDFVRELETTCATPKAVLTPQPALDTPQETRAGGSVVVEERGGQRAEGSSSRHHWKTAGIVAGGTGIAVLGIGLGLGFRGTAIGDEITSACRTSCDWDALKDKDTRGRRYVQIGRVLDVAGVAAIAGGAIFYYLGSRQSSSGSLGARKDAISVAPTPARNGAVVTWSGAW